MFLERSRTPHDIAFTGAPAVACTTSRSGSTAGRTSGGRQTSSASTASTSTSARSRHGITRGHTIYFFDPVGNRNEVFSGGYHVDPDWEVIT